jgi:hypothetical protein
MHSQFRSENLKFTWMIILKWNLRKQIGRVWTRCGSGSVVSSCEDGNKPSDIITGGEFLH